MQLLQGKGNVYDFEGSQAVPVVLVKEGWKRGKNAGM